MHRLAPPWLSNSRTDCIFTFVVCVCFFLFWSKSRQWIVSTERHKGKKIKNKKASAQSETVLSSERREDLSKWVEETAERGFVACKSSAWKPSHPSRLSENLVPGAEIRRRNRVLANAAPEERNTPSRSRSGGRVGRLLVCSAKSPAGRVSQWEEGRDPSGEGHIRGDTEVLNMISLYIWATMWWKWFKK